MIITLKIISTLLCVCYALFVFSRLRAVLRDLRDTYHIRGLRVTLVIGAAVLMLAVMPILLYVLIMFYLARFR